MAVMNKSYGIWKTAGGGVFYFFFAAFSDFLI